MAQQQAGIFDSVDEHLKHVQQAPDAVLNGRLLEEAEIFLVPQLAQDDQRRAALVSQIVTLLPQLQQYPGPLIQLLKKLSAPYSFTQILSMQPPVDFVAGLDLAAEPYHLLMISLLRKAADSTLEVAQLASMPPVMLAFVKLWLLSPNIGVGQAAGDTLIALLVTDKEANPVAAHGLGGAEMTGNNQDGGQGLMWRRMFGDRDVYRSMIRETSTGPFAQRTIPQGRLISFASKLAVLDWNCLTHNHQQDIDLMAGMHRWDGGFLDFIANSMVNTDHDVLMHVTLIQFYKDMMTEVRNPSTQKHVSVSLEFLQSRGIHDKTIALWLRPDDLSHNPANADFLYGPSADYYAAYASTYPEALLQDHMIREAEDGLPSALIHLSQAMSLTPSRWAQGKSPVHDLSVLVALPRVALLPYSPLGTGRQSSPLLMIPSKSTSVEALKSLAAVFHGPQRRAAIAVSTPGEASSTIGGDNASDPLFNAEAAAARALYHLYVHHHDTLLVDLIAHASILALPEKATAALNLLTAIATANWAPLPAVSAYNAATPPDSPAALPDEATLKSWLPTSADRAHEPSATGIEALVQSPHAGRLTEFLLTPQPSFAALAGSRGGGDPDSAAYRVAMAQWDCVRAVRDALAALGPTASLAAKQVLARAESRILEGPWGRRGDAAAGSRIATLEM